MFVNSEEIKLLSRLQSSKSAVAKIECTDVYFDCVILEIALGSKTCIQHHQ